MVAGALGRDPQGAERRTAAEKDEDNGGDDEDEDDDIGEDDDEERRMTTETNLFGCAGSRTSAGSEVKVSSATIPNDATLNESCCVVNGMMWREWKSARIARRTLRA